MKKFMTVAMACAFLAVSGGWAQTAQNPRKHTRPPYSGPRKAGKGLKKPLPRVRASSKRKTGTPLDQKPKSDHIIVR